MSRLIVSFAIGGSASNTETRNIGRTDLLAGGGGVQSFIDNRITPAMALGARSLEIHNPWGQGTGVAMEASQFLLAEQAGLKETIGGFVQAWTPVVSRAHEVIAYCGGLSRDPSFYPLNAWAYLERVRRSFTLLWEAGMSQAFDADVFAPEHSDAAETIQLIAEARKPFSNFYHSNLDGRPRKVYLEPWWSATIPWAWQYPIFILESFYQTIKAQSFVGYRPPSSQMPEVIRIMTPPVGESDADLASLMVWAPAQAAQVVADGHTPMIGGDPFVDSNQPYSLLGVPL